MTHNPFATPNGSAGNDEEFTLDEDYAAGDMPDGSYAGKCIAVAKDTSKSGNPMWVFSFVCVDPAFAGKEFKLYAALTPSAMWKAAEVLAAFGIGSAKDGKIKASFKKSDVVNKPVTLKIKNEEYNGRQSPKCAGISPPR